MENNSNDLNSTHTSALISACVLLQFEDNIAYVLTDNTRRSFQNLSECRYDGMSAKASVRFSLHIHEYAHAHVCK